MAIFKIIYFSEWDIMFNQWQSRRFRNSFRIIAADSGYEPPSNIQRRFCVCLVVKYYEMWIRISAWLATAINKPVTCAAIQNTSRLLTKIIGTDVYSRKRTFKSESTIFMFLQIFCAHSRLPFLLCENICHRLRSRLGAFCFVCHIM